MRSSSVDAFRGRLYSAQPQWPSGTTSRWTSASPCSRTPRSVRRASPRRWNAPASRARSRRTCSRRATSWRSSTPRRSRRLPDWPVPMHGRWRRGTRPARQGVELVQIVISDLKGILAVDALALSRRSWREFVKRLPRQNVVATVEIPKDHARQLIAEAEAAGARNGFSPPPAYADALRLLGPAPQTPPPSPGLSLELPDELAHQLAGAALFEDPLLMAWIPEEDDLRRLALRLDYNATSQLYIDT